MKTLTIRMSPEEHARLKASAARERMPMAAYLLRLWDADSEARGTLPKPLAKPAAAAPRPAPMDDDDADAKLLAMWGNE